MPTPKYNWDALKKEYLISNDLTVRAFCERKGLPNPTKNSYIAKRTTGWAGQKKKVKEKALEDYAKTAADEMLADTKKVRIEQAKIAGDVILKAITYLKGEGAKIKSVETARKLLETGIKIQREALGISDKVSKDQGLTQINVYMSKFGKIFEESDEEGIIKLLETIGNIRRQRSPSNGEQIEGVVGHEVDEEVKELQSLD